MPKSTPSKNFDSEETTVYEYHGYRFEKAQQFLFSLENCNLKAFVSATICLPNIYQFFCKEHFRILDMSKCLFGYFLQKTVGEKIRK